MNKLKMHTADLTQDNIAKLAELFPDCVTESRDEAGNVNQAIDFDQLRQVLSDHVVEGPQERYHLNWPGKREALLAANSPIAKTLRPCREESVDFDTTKNLFIEGDNLDALKLLLETYLNKVKMIYIDPPYNTGNDFIYDDNFAEDAGTYLARSYQRDDAGFRLLANPEAHGRFHSDWLSMMFSRLRLARSLLRDDGVMLISIDDHEIDNLKKVCKEIFGENGVLGCLVSKRRQVADNRNYNRLSVDHEYILICAKSGFRFRGRDKDESKYSNPDNDPRGPWMSDNMTGLASKQQRPNLHYDIVNPQTGAKYPPHPGRGWGYSPDRMQELIRDRRVLWPTKPDGRPRLKRFLSELSDLRTGFSTWQELGYTTDGTREISDLLGFKAFDFPKPLSLGTTLCHQSTTGAEDEIVLDFFAGSSTLAHAVIKLNAEDGGRRRFIMVQLPEPCDEGGEAFRGGFKTIADISKERVRRAGKKMKEEAGLNGQRLDIGFRVLKIDNSNMKDVYYRPDQVTPELLGGHVDNIKDGRTDEDLLFQVLLDWGVDLSLPIRKESIGGKNVYFVDDNALAACFETGINEAFVKELAVRKPLRVVFRDTGYGGDDVKINVEQIFKQLSPGTEVKTL
jgi:adenine-specific DNA-methyltransferase